MDRYTKRGRSGNVYVTGAATVCWGGRTVDERLFCVNCHGAKDNRDVDRSKCGPLAIIDRLAAYEDTGLDPEEVLALDAPEPNTPLTLAELREMADKCEGVYVAHIDGSPVFRGLKYCAAVLDFSLAFGSTTMHVHAIYGDRLTMWEDDYGKTWLAYRRKPEEVTM